MFAALKSPQKSRQIWQELNAISNRIKNDSNDKKQKPIIVPSWPLSIRKYN